MTTKERLHQLVDALPESELKAAERFLEALCKGEDLLLRVLEEAPEDDEPETAEERTAVAEAREDVKRGRLVSSEEMHREFNP